MASRMRRTDGRYNTVETAQVACVSFVITPEMCEGCRSSQPATPCSCQDTTVESGVDGSPATASCVKHEESCTDESSSTSSPWSVCWSSADYSTDFLDRLPTEVVFTIELFLPVQSLIALSAVNRLWASRMSEQHWHLIFKARWSHCYEAKSLTVSPSILSRLSGNYNSFWGTIEKAFMGDYSIVGGNDPTARESLFQKIFKLLQPAADIDIKTSRAWPFIMTGGSPKTAQLPSWKLACVLRDRSGHVLMGCRLCSQLDVFTPHMREMESSCPTQLRTWIVPCLCPSLVHRRCLEAQVKPRWPGPRWISYDTADAQLELTEGSLGKCGHCGAFYISGFRLPTVGELIAATWQDSLAWKRARDCLVMWATALAIVSLSEALYEGRGALLRWPQEGHHVLFWWLLQYAVSLNIFLSPRFARVVDLIWFGPIFSFYAKLYLYFLFSTSFMAFTFTPWPLRLWQAMCKEGRLKGGGCSAGVCVASYPVWWMVLGWVNFVTLFAMMSMVIFLFWKTNYRISTIADRREGGLGFEHPMLSIGGA